VDVEDLGGEKRWRWTADVSVSLPASSLVLGVPHAQQGNSKMLQRRAWGHARYRKEAHHHSSLITLRKKKPTTVHLHLISHFFSKRGGGEGKRREFRLKASKCDIIQGR